MPQIIFDDDPEWEKGVLWTTTARERTDEAFARVRREFGAG